MMEGQMNEAIDGMSLQEVGHHMMGVPPGLAALQPEAGGSMPDDGQDSAAKFKPIDLERLSPK